MQVIDEAFYRKLGSLAEQRGVTVQELIRAIIIPDWVQRFEEDEQRRELERRHRRATGRRVRPLRASPLTIRLRKR